MTGTACDSLTIRLSPKHAAWSLSLALVTGLVVGISPWAVAILLGLGLYYYFWHHREHLVVFLLVYTPLEELVLKLLPDALYAPVRYMWEGLLFALVATLIIQRLILSESWKRSIYDYLMLLFLGAWVLSTIVNGKTVPDALLHIKNLIRYICVFYLIYHSQSNKTFLRRVTRVILVMAAVQACVCGLQVFAGDFVGDFFRPEEVVVDGKLIRGEDIQEGTYHTKFTGTFARSNDLGHYLAFALCLLVARSLFLGQRLHHVVGLMLIVGALFFSSSRISWISAFVGVGLILFVLRHPKRWIYVLVPVVVLAIVLPGITMVGSHALYADMSIVHRFFHLFTPDFLELDHTAGRLYAILQTAPAVLTTSPLFGLGPGSFMPITETIDKEYAFAGANQLGLQPFALRYTHDVGYVALFVQGGLLGLVAFVLLFVMLYRRVHGALHKEIDPEIRAFMVGGLGFLVALAVQSLASFNVTYRNQSLVIWTVCGLLALFSARIHFRSSRASEESGVRIPS